MELRHLRYFVAVADALSFTHASRTLRVAQPSLSVQMSKLEQEIGVALFEREGRGIRLTDAGAVFLERARQMLTSATDSVAAARRTAAGETGRLVIGHNTPAEFRVFPKVVPELKRRWPEVALEFHNLRGIQLLEGLRRGELHLGFLWRPIPTEGFTVVDLTREPLSAVLPRDHPLAARKRVSVRELAAEDLIMFSLALDPGSSWEIKRLFERQGAAMRIVQEMDSVLSTLNFVSMGLGCSILPDYTRDIAAQGVVYRPLVPNVVKRLAMIRPDDAGQIAVNAFALVEKAMGSSVGPF